MACHWERLSYLPSPHGFEETTSFLATSYLSDIRLRIEEILAELEPWQICTSGWSSSTGKRTTGLR